MALYLILQPRVKDILQLSFNGVTYIQNKFFKAQPSVANIVERSSGKIMRFTIGGRIKGFYGFAIISINQTVTEINTCLNPLTLLES